MKSQRDDLAAADLIGSTADFSLRLKDGGTRWWNGHLDFLRRFLPFHHGVPCGRWLTILMNRVNPALFSACFTAWVKQCWPDRPELIAIDGKTSRRSHDRATGAAPLHLVSAFATTSRLVLAQEAVPDKANELAAIPVLLDRLGVDGGLEGAMVSIDAIACNGTVAKAVRGAGADYLLAVKANQPTLRVEIETLFSDPETEQQRFDDLDKGHGRIERRRVSVVYEVGWLDGARLFPGELRLPDVACVIKVEGRTELKDRCRFDTRYYISSASLTAIRAAEMVRGSVIPSFFRLGVPTWELHVLSVFEAVFWRLGSLDVTRAPRRR